MYYLLCVKTNRTMPPASITFDEPQYSVVDPGGHSWTFSESIADLAREEWGGTSADLG